MFTQDTLSGPPVTVARAQSEEFGEHVTLQVGDGEPVCLSLECAGALSKELGVRAEPGFSEAE
jgi:hypothetical protein